MGYRIYAWLDDGRPTLRIVDARSNTECLSWSFQGEDGSAPGGQKAIQSLFRDLLLLSCKQRLGEMPQLGPVADLQSDAAFVVS